MKRTAPAGYRWPAEWEPHAGTWVSWPHNVESWPGRFDVVEPAFAQMVRAIAEGETVWINVCDDAMAERAGAVLRQVGAVGDIRLVPIATNDAWCRDHGAIFLAGQKGLMATDWRYNAWGNKYPHDLDDAVAKQMAEVYGCKHIAFEMVLEGGSIDGNGCGAVLTTEACLLNKNRNPKMSRDEIETGLRQGLGVEDILWLGDGIEGDDTDGHIDDITRFVGEKQVVTVMETDPHDANHRPLQRNRERLATMTVGGSFLDVVELPMPPAMMIDEQRVPASYANFYITNTKVLLPGYHPPTDERARSILAELFPKRDVEVIDCRDLIWGLGAFHCLTQQVPAVSE